MNAIAGALGFVPSADPTAYTNQVTLTQQTTEAITALKSTATMVSTFATAMTLIPGGDPVFIQKIKDLDEKAKKAVSSTAGKSPAQIAKDTSEITSALSSLQLEKSAPVEKTQLQKLQDALAVINNRLNEVEAKNISDELIQPYRDLKSKTEGRISDLIALQIQTQQAQQEQQAQQSRQEQESQQEQATQEDQVENFVVGPPAAIDPVVQDDPLAALDKLNAATMKVIESDISPMGILRNVISHTGKALYYILLIACLWLGGSATSNTFHDKSLLIKIWYFIYGAILFQLTIPIYGIFFPPKWHALLIPLFDNGKTTHPVIKALFGHDSINKHRIIPQAGGDAEAAAPTVIDKSIDKNIDKSTEPTAATEKAPVSVQTKGKTLLDSQQVLRYSSIGAYIGFHTLYYLLQYFF